MRHLRQPVLDVLLTAAAAYGVAATLVRLPERGLVDPAGLAQHPLGKSIGVEHLHGSAGDTVGLPEQQWTRLLVDDAGGDIRECRELRSQVEPRRTAADDQHVDLARTGA